MRLKTLAAILVGLGLAAVGAEASPINWTFSGTSGVAGTSGNITGSFEFDGSSISAWTINIPSNFFNPYTLPAETLTPSNSSQGGNGGAFTLFSSNDGNTLFYIVNAFDPGTAGTVTNEELIDQYQVSPGNFYEAIWTGNLVGTQVTPEPGTWALLGTGLLAMFGLGWRRRRAALTVEG